MGRKVVRWEITLNVFFYLSMHVIYTFIIPNIIEFNLMQIIKLVVIMVTIFLFFCTEN